MPKCTAKCLSWDPNDESLVNFHLVAEMILPFKWRQLETDMILVARKPVLGVSDQVDINQTVQPQKIARGL